MNTKYDFEIGDTIRWVDSQVWQNSVITGFHECGDIWVTDAVDGSGMFGQNWNLEFVKKFKPNEGRQFIVGNLYQHNTNKGSEEHCWCDWTGDGHALLRYADHTPQLVWDSAIDYYNDYVMPPKPRVAPSRWINVYQRPYGEDIYLGNRTYTVKEKAIDAAKNQGTDLIDTIEITYTESVKPLSNEN